MAYLRHLLNSVHVGLLHSFSCVDSIPSDDVKVTRVVHSEGVLVASGVVG